jgi:hypothetical protein
LRTTRWSINAVWVSWVSSWVLVLGWLEENKIWYCILHTVLFFAKSYLLHNLFLFWLLIHERIKGKPSKTRWLRERYRKNQYSKAQI